MRISGTDESVQEAYGLMAMKDLPWGKYLNSKHREDVVSAVRRIRRARGSASRQVAKIGEFTVLPSYRAIKASS